MKGRSFFLLPLLVMGLFGLSGCGTVNSIPISDTDTARPNNHLYQIDFIPNAFDRSRHLGETSGLGGSKWAMDEEATRLCKAENYFGYDLVKTTIHNGSDIRWLIQCTEK